MKTTMAQNVRNVIWRKSFAHTHTHTLLSRRDNILIQKIGKFTFITHILSEKVMPNATTVHTNRGTLSTCISCA